MYPFINKLIEIFKRKKGILQELKQALDEIKKTADSAQIEALFADLSRANNELSRYTDSNDKTSIQDENGISMARIHRLSKPAARPIWPRNMPV